MPVARVTPKQWRRTADIVAIICQSRQTIQWRHVREHLAMFPRNEAGRDNGIDQEGVRAREQVKEAPLARLGDSITRLI